VIGQPDLSTVRRRNAGELPQLAKLQSELGIGDHGGDATVVGTDPLVRSPHRLAEASAYAHLLEGMAAAEIWINRTGSGSSVEIELVDALHALHTTHFLRQAGYGLSVGAEYVATNGLYQRRDGRYLMIEAGPPYAKLERGYLNFFDCGNNRESLSREIAKFAAEELEEKLSALGLPACLARTRTEWLNHPQGVALHQVPLIEIEKLAPGKPKGLQGASEYPLSGLRAIDFTHVLAGPRSMRALAQLGAEVLHISSPYNRDVISQNLLVNMGKRSAYLQLTESADLSKLRALAAQADVFACSYRESVPRRFGLEPQSLASASDGIVCLSIDAYGHAGPWQDRPGFDQNGQSATGVAITEGGEGAPRFSPVFYLNDELTGHLAAAGVMRALFRRATEGGSYHVKVSLSRTAMWVQDLGSLDGSDYRVMPETDVYPPKLRTVHTTYGEITELAPETRFSNLPQVTLSTLRPFGADKPQWSEP
jgi:crotonobetainyl-CoA:carnitine CoA-transferase CaiB-like acyl-CoA transferase